MTNRSTLMLSTDNADIKINVFCGHTSSSFIEIEIETENEQNIYTLIEVLGKQVSPTMNRNGKHFSRVRVKLIRIHRSKKRPCIIHIAINGTLLCDDVDHVVSALSKCCPELKLSKSGTNDSYYMDELIRTVSEYALFEGIEKGSSILMHRVPTINASISSGITSELSQLSCSDNYSEELVPLTSSSSDVPPNLSSCF